MQFLCFSISYETEGLVLHLFVSLPSAVFGIHWFLLVFKPRCAAVDGPRFQQEKTTRATRARIEFAFAPNPATTLRSDRASAAPTHPERSRPRTLRQPTHPPQPPTPGAMTADARRTAPSERVRG